MRLSRLSPFLLATPLVLGGCEDLTGGGDDNRVTLRFATPTSTTRSLSAAPGVGFFAGAGAEGRVIRGSNGTLTLTDIRLLVAEFELERADGREDGCDEDDCEDFEASPRFVRLPVDGGTVSIATDEVPTGTYDELEFEVKNLDENDDDDDERGFSATALFEEIRREFPNFPRQASMVVTGTFQPTVGPAVPFTVFFDAEIEVELDLQPPLVVADGARPAVTVTLDPQSWFLRNGQVRRLDQMNFATTSRVYGFEQEIKGGIRGRAERD